MEVLADAMPDDNQWPAQELHDPAALKGSRRSLTRLPSGTVQPCVMRLKYAIQAADPPACDEVFTIVYFYGGC